ncbi:GDP-mannose 4,6-dehydratase [Hyphomicrobium sp. LHD-15]|uniref:GDP-mannose 4,6-dehydratase n=1 Tax=Hyphomicrobium sp. LHD-15 TaxID=3072142 RepID=UPI00280FA2CE|nr:GDP-mannose 4,6-dehydratase [Hyphomicrobium sp. LHD-15]MDQ8699874.1 GDP-mannose 4,6-dehydratase [Hyphomicrobium sp. LHD-15]
MRVLVTGAGGFVGPYLIAALRDQFGSGLDLVATSKDRVPHPSIGTIEALDVCDAAAVEEIVRRVQPDHIVHLAGLAAIPKAAANVDLAWNIHLFGSLHIARAVLRHVPKSVLHHISTGQVYGASALPGLALDETVLLAPNNTYSATKASADLALGALAAEGLRCIRLRPFNHIGPGQSEDFVVSSFAMQVARIEAGLQEPVMRVGNLDAERDFLDVRDIAAAYALAIKKSGELEAGAVLNIASGRPVRIRDILHRLVKLSGVQIAVEQDAARMRPSDIPRYIGDAARARQILGWSPKWEFETTLTDILNDARNRVREAAGGRA